MAEGSIWGDIPAGILRDIFRQLPCVLDRRSVASDEVCASWREALAEIPPPPHRLPLLLLPLDDGPAFACILSGGAIHHDEVTVPDPEEPGRDARCRYFASYEGGWLFRAVNQTGGYILSNIYNHAHSINLPNVVLGLVVHDYFLGPDPDAPPEAGEGAGAQPLEMVIFAVALSSPPDVQGCIAAAIITCPPHFLAARGTTFWRMGDLEAPVALEPAEWGMVFEDVVHYLDAFYFLTQSEQIYICAPNFLQDGAVLEAHFQLLYIVPIGGYNMCVQARYLVESRGDLLMVVKLSSHPGLPTSAFKVFEIVGAPIGPNGATAFIWDELPMLDGRMLFVAHGCSRSYEVAEYPGFEGGVYFLDDHDFFDVATMFTDANEREYCSFDNGRWSPHHVDRPFMMPAPSNYSPPVWLLH